jgi:hypothetical protein
MICGSHAYLREWVSYSANEQSSELFLPYVLIARFIPFQAPAKVAKLRADQPGPAGGLIDREPGYSPSCRSLECGHSRST